MCYADCLLNPLFPLPSIVDPSPPATGQIVEAYNSLRGNILLLYDLRSAMLQCDYELQAARARMQLFAADRVSSECYFSAHQSSLG